MEYTLLMLLGAGIGLSGSIISTLSKEGFNIDWGYTPLTLKSGVKVGIKILRARVFWSPQDMINLCSGLRQDTKKVSYKKYLKQFGVGFCIGWIGMFVSVLSGEVFNQPLGYATPSVKNVAKNSAASGLATMGMLFILENGQINGDVIFPK